MYLVCDHLCLVRIVKYAQHPTTTLSMTSAPAVLERHALTVADAAPALARGPRPLPSPEAGGGGERSRPLTLCGSLRSDLARRWWCHRRRGRRASWGRFPARSAGPRGVGDGCRPEPPPGTLDVGDSGRAGRRRAVAPTHSSSALPAPPQPPRFTPARPPLGVSRLLARSRTSTSTLGSGCSWAHGDSRCGGCDGGRGGGWPSVLMEVRPGAGRDDRLRLWWRQGRPQRRRRLWWRQRRLWRWL